VCAFACKAASLRCLPDGYGSPPWRSRMYPVVQPRHLFQIQYQHSQKCIWQCKYVPVEKWATATYCVFPNCSLVSGGMFLGVPVQKVKYLEGKVVWKEIQLAVYRQNWMFNSYQLWESRVRNDATTNANGIPCNKSFFAKRNRRNKPIIYINRNGQVQEDHCWKNI
jgi:hypothetical protein